MFSDFSGVWSYVEHNSIRHGSNIMSECMNLFNFTFYISIYVEEETEHPTHGWLGVFRDASFSR